MNGYKLLLQKVLSEYHAEGFLYEHEKSGARVLFMKAPLDDNKVFSISFKTLPENSKGIPHILEHSVLNGSRKFPTKEPFVDLLKGSMNTFLNAMTFPDKTMYPVASRNEKDFFNLMDVYMDAVFYPNVKKDSFVFRQEGWHYELESPEDEITLKGVVYNEMKGAYSQPEEVLMELVNKELFPDTIYAVSSGGNPEVIPTLSYEEFKAFHDTYYRPENCYIFLYGDMDEEKVLGFLDREYLSDFTKDPAYVFPEVNDQPAFEAPREVVGQYSVTEDEDPEDKTYLSYNVVIGHSFDPMMYYGLPILASILGNNEASPIKRALLNAGIGMDNTCYADTSVRQPILQIMAINASADQKDEFVRVIEDTLKDVVKNGIDPKLYQAVMNRAEFSLRENSLDGTPKGLLLAIQCMDSWLHIDNPLTGLGYEAYMRELREDKDWFVNMIEENILHNPHKAIAVLEAAPGLNLKREEALKEKLKAYKESLSEEEIEALVKATHDMHERQLQPDRPEDLEKIPLLGKEDIGLPHLPQEAHDAQLDGRFTGVYNGVTNHIVYSTTEFSLLHVPAELLSYLGLFVNVMGRMNTKNYGYEDLDSEMGCHLGGYSFDMGAVPKQSGEFAPYLSYRFKCLEEETANGYELGEEVLLTTDFTDEKRLKEIIAENRIRMEDAFSYSGNEFALSRAMSHFSVLTAFREKTGRIDYYFFLKDLEEHFEEKKAEVIRNLQKLASIVLRSANVSFRLILEKEAEEKTLALASEFLKHMPEGHDEAESQKPMEIELTTGNEAFITPGQVQYVAKAGRFHDAYHGQMAVMGQILSLDYLWTKVRAQGGAYGCSKEINRRGYVGMSSYRDPNLERTLEIYDQAYEAMEQVELSERELTKYIIGTAAGLDPVVGVLGLGTNAINGLRGGLKNEDFMEIWNEVIGATEEDIHESAHVLKEAMSENFVCCLGSESKIEENKDLFDRVVKLF